MNQQTNIPNHLTLCTVQQSRQMDEDTIEKFGIDGFTLIEIAASGAAGIIKKEQGENKSGLYVCGKGNNGGDALAVARYLVNQAGHEATVYMVMGNSDLSPDAGKNFSLLQTMRNEGANIEFISDLDSTSLHDFDFLVDGIFGTGLNSNVRPPVSELIAHLNRFKGPVYAMDVPSGLNADTGLPLGISIKAELTCTFGSNKIGFYLNQASQYTGRVKVIDLPFPLHIRKHTAVLINDELAEMLPVHKKDSEHKYDGKVVHILAGSEGLTGAAIMSAKSAWKSGAGAVFLYTPKKHMDLYEKTLPQVIKISLGKEADHFFQPNHAELIIENLNQKPGVLLVGPGLGDQPETGECIEKVLDSFDGKAVIDADAFRYWPQLKDKPESKRENWMLTPHKGEAKKYLGATFDNESDRIRWAKTFANKNRLTLLLKGDPTVVCLPNGKCFITGYPTGMFTRAGFGDVLAGTIATNLSIYASDEQAVIKSLYSGYKTYSASDDNQVFGPEHLI